MVKVPVKRSGVRVRIKRRVNMVWGNLQPKKDYQLCFRCKVVWVDEFVWYCPKCQAIVKREMDKLDEIQSRRVSEVPVE